MYTPKDILDAGTELQSMYADVLKRVAERNRSMKYDLKSFDEFTEYRRATTHSKEFTKTLTIAFNDKNPRMMISADLYEKIGSPENVSVYENLRDKSLAIVRWKAGRASFRAKRRARASAVYLSGLANLMDKLFCLDIVKSNSLTRFDAFYDKDSDAIFVNLESAHVEAIGK